MKKYISILLALVLALALCACNKSDDDPTIGGSNASTTAKTITSTQFKGKKLEPTIQLIASDKYMYEVKGSDNNIPITYAKYGDKVLITCVIDGTPTSYIRMNGKKYIAFSAKKMYAEITDADVQKYGLQSFDDSTAVLDFSVLQSCTYKSSGSAAVGDTTYDYEDYYNPMSQTTNRFFFNTEGKLVYMASVDSNGTQAGIITISLYEATSSVFDTLNTYTLVDLANEQAMVPADSTTTAK